MVYLLDLTRYIEPLTQIVGAVGLLLAGVLNLLGNLVSRSSHMVLLASDQARDPAQWSRPRWASQRHHYVDCMSTFFLIDTKH